MESLAVIRYGPGIEVEDRLEQFFDVDCTGSPEPYLAILNDTEWIHASKKQFLKQ